MRKLATALLLAALLCGCSTQYRGSVSVYELTDEERQISESEHEYFVEYSSHDREPVHLHIDLSELPSLVELMNDLEDARTRGLDENEMGNEVAPEAGRSWLISIVLDEDSPGYSSYKGVEIFASSLDETRSEDNSLRVKAQSVVFLRDGIIYTSSLGAISSAQIAKYAWLPHRKALWKAMLNELEAAEAAEAERIRELLRADN